MLRLVAIGQNGIFSNPALIESRGGAGPIAFAFRATGELLFSCVSHCVPPSNAEWVAIGYAAKAASELSNIQSHRLFPGEQRNWR